MAAKRVTAIKNASPASPRLAQVLEGALFLESPRLLASCAGSKGDVAAPFLNRGIGLNSKRVR